MEIAVTADLHLTAKSKHPERFHALEDILKQMLRSKIGILVVAGDLFDEENRNTSEFELLCKDPKYRSIQFHIIPGNHDLRLSAKSFASENITVYSQPELKQFDLMSLPLLFLPFRKEQTMGEALAPFDSQIRRGEWILVGHGDWVEGMNEPNPLEPGVYMPLTRTDIESTQPARAILGHIHKPYDKETVLYPGSPCGLDITETGRRRFLVLDAETGSVKSKPVATDVLFFDEWLITLPVENEEPFVQEKLAVMMKSWKISESEKNRVTIRLKVSGYTTDKSRLMKTICNVCKGMRFYPDDEPDLSEVSVSEDVERAGVAERVRRVIDAMEWPDSPDAPSREAAFLHALRAIYEP